MNADDNNICASKVAIMAAFFIDKVIDKEGHFVCRNAECELGPCMKG